MRGAGRRPRVERLIERDRAAGHGVAVHVEQAKRDLAGVPEAARIWLVPEMASSSAYSGRAPKAENVTHWLVPLRQA